MPFSEKVFFASGRKPYFFIRQQRHCLCSVVTESRLYFTVILPNYIWILKRPYPVCFR